MKLLSWLKGFSLLDYFLLLASVILFAFVLSPLSTVFKTKMIMLNAKSSGSDERKVLSIVQGVEESNGISFKAIKLQSKAGIEVEIYDQSSQPSPTLVATHVLKKHINGFFHLQGEPAELAFVDVDFNQIIDLVVSTYDQTLTPRLNVFSFDPESKKFVHSPPNP